LHPKTLDINPSQKQIPTAIGEKQKKQTENIKTREPSKQPSTNSVQQKYSNQSSSSLYVPQNTPHTYHCGTCLRNPRKGRHLPEKNRPKKEKPTNQPKTSSSINQQGTQNGLPWKEIPQGKKNPTTSNSNNNNSKYKTKERASQQAKQDSGGEGKRRSWGPQGALGE
jgi:protein tyrosine phosphatase (PTP) superfamily phosphohydrolase (DUF442 family)